MFRRFRLHGAARKLGTQLSFALLFALGACATTPPAAPHMPVGASVRAPTGLIDFCSRNATDCAPGARDGIATLTEARWKELNDVNLAINRSVRPVTDLVLVRQVEYWEYPDAGAGDCEDYALAKRRELLRRGWPAEALLLATARNQARELHAVLIVATDRGDFVLDNATDFVEAWDARPYQWVARQSPGNVLAWNRAGTDTALVTTASLP